MSQTFSLGLLATAAMVVGAPLVYADQAYSIARRRNSEGFSKDVCAVLLLANIARIFWWLKVKFEFGESLHPHLHAGRLTDRQKKTYHTMIRTRFQPSCCSRSS